MTYSNKIKEEILNLKTTNINEVLGEIFGMLFSKNLLESKNVNFTTENMSLAKRLYKNLKFINCTDVSLNYVEGKRSNSEKICEVKFSIGSKLNDEFQRLYKIKETNSEILKSILRGFFLVTGYIKTPEKGYSMDFFLENRKSAKYLHDLLKNKKKRVFTGEKGNKYVVYLRNSEDILDVIFMIGSINSFFQFEEVTINKEIRNKINRAINWEIANEAKKFTTSEKQINMINKIDEKIGLDNISKVLKEAAEIRLKNEEASLQELADMIGVSKSGIRNRFRRLEEIYMSINID